ncbi:HYpothetical protein A7982_00259 [Minicystis rosea]|nr:HYpothetical protein A7982_00259 [Minicystis rosea]
MKMVHLFLGSIVAAAAFAGARSFTSAAAPQPEPMPAIMPPASTTAPPPASADGAPVETIAGEVLETIDVSSYSYLRLGAKGSEGTWVAVPTAKLAVGTPVRVVSSLKMTDFKSATLKRTFPVIYFGTLDDGKGTPPALEPHANGAPPPGLGGDPHGGAAPVEIPVKPGPRAAGPNGKTVAEVIGQRTQLDGKTVRVRGTVVKVTVGVLGRNYFHLRDGSGDASAGTHDLTVTSEATPAIGDAVEIEGKVAIDRDIGSGYTFPTLVEDARLVASK